MNTTNEREQSARHCRLRHLLCVGAGLCLLICTGCAAWQRKLIYFPPRFTPAQVDEFARSARLEQWSDPAGRPIGMKRLSLRQPAAGRVLITYGNGSCATGCAHYADVIQEVAAWDVFILEYPGYANRTGTPSQRNLFRAADEAFQLVATNSPVYLVGESLGTGVAAYLAGTHSNQVAGVVLLAPFNRLVDVAQHHYPILPVRLLLVDQFSSEDYLRQYRGPVAVLVAGRDRVVPEKYGRRLYDSYAGPKRLWEFPAGDHGTVMTQPPTLWEQIIKFLQTA